MAQSRKAKGKQLVVEKRPCIWMTAGVVNFKLCDMNYDCINCRFDKGMGKKISEESHLEGVGVNWRKVFNELPPEKRYCRHMLNHHVGYKVCGNSFMCHKCEFDQMIEDEMATLDPVIPRGVRMIEGFSYPDTYYFHRGHGYAMVDYGGRIRVGFDDFSTRLVGLLDKVEAPMLGETVHVNETGWSLAREGHHAEMLSPIEGVVTAVNYKALKNPEMVNISPYETGWLYMMEPLHMKNDLKNLFYGDETLSWARMEISRLRDIVTEEIGPTASAGGMATRDIYGELPEVGWNRLTNVFLLTA